MYFRRENFLNLGYTAPLREIAATLNREAGRDDIVLVDAYNTDVAGLAASLSGRAARIALDPEGVAEARRRSGSAPTVWIVRNTRDASPGQITTNLETEVCAGRPRRDTLLDPFAGWQQSAMRVAGFRPVPTHFYQFTACGQAAGAGSGK